jgi:hypothetical protein
MGGVGLVGPRRHKSNEITYKSHFACVDKWLGGEPFPHKSAGGAVVDRIDQPANIVVDYPRGSQLMLIKVQASLWFNNVVMHRSDDQ